MRLLALVLCLGSVGCEEEEVLPGSTCASYGVECVCPDGRTACAPYSNNNICPCGDDSYSVLEGGPVPPPSVDTMGTTATDTNATGSEGTDTASGICASGGPTLEAVSLPASFAVRREHERVGTVALDAAGHVTFESHGEMTDVSAELQSLVEEIEEDGYVGFTFSARAPGRRARCGRQVDRDHPTFADAVRHKLRSSNFTLAE
ncbi:MAG: hypothetical protein AAGE52_15860 [Myxococcota bacterium]